MLEPLTSNVVRVSGSGELTLQLPRRFDAISQIAEMPAGLPSPASASPQQGWFTFSVVDTKTGCWPFRRRNRLAVLFWHDLVDEMDISIVTYAFR